MKKLITFGVFFFIFFSVIAQTRLSKTNVVGKWTISAVEMPGMFYYSIEKDSVSLGDMMKAQVQDQQQLASITSMMKSQMAMFSKISFLFNADGTAELGAGTEQAQTATYTVNEENSTITTIDKDKKEDTIKVDLIDDKIRFTLKQPQGEIMMIMKKAKA